MSELGVVRTLAPLRSWNPWLVPTMVVLGVLAALSEGIGLSLFMPFLYSLGQGTFAPPEDGVLGALFHRTLQTIPESDRLVVVALGILGLVLLKNLLVYASETVRSWTHTIFVHGLRARVAHRLVESRIDFIENTDSGKLLNTLQNQTQETGAAFATHGELLARACTSLVFGVFLFLVSWKLTLGVGCALVVISLLIRLAWRRVEHGSERFVTSWDELAQRGLELVSGMRTIRVFGREEYERQRFARASERASRTWFRLDLLSGLVRPASEVLIVAVFVVILVGSLRDVTHLPTILTFAFILYRLRPHVQGIDVSRAQLLAAKAPVETVMGILVSSHVNETHTGSRPFMGLADAIRFDHVSFRHSSAESDTLREITATIPAGATTAIVGPSGAGKSTLMHLILRLYEPTQGSIDVNGVPLHAYDIGSWRSAVAAVTQDALLFNASVAENIAYGRADAGLDQVVRAARMAGADAFIRELPRGYDTRVGDQGVRLSGGQKQRLALARALVREPQILLLDEATNALDAETESLVHDAVAAMGEALTVIVVSHRLSAVARADHFVFLEEGRVTAQGDRANMPALMEKVQRLYGQSFGDVLARSADAATSTGGGE